MDNAIASQIETVCAAFAEGASAADTRAGAVACRTLLAVLETQPGQPLGSSTAVSPRTSALGLLGHLDVDQMLDLVIHKLRAMVPTDAGPNAVSRGFQLPALTLTGGGR